MNTTPRPNFVLVCIAVLLLSFSFAGEMLCSLSPDITAQSALASREVIIASSKVAGGLRQAPAPQLVAGQAFAPNSLAQAVLIDIELAQQVEELAASPEIAEKDSVNQQIDRSETKAIEASSSNAPVGVHHQFVYDNAPMKLVGNSIKTKRAGKSIAQAHGQPESAGVTELNKVQQITVRVQHNGYLALMPNAKKVAAKKLQQAIAQLNNAGKETSKVELLIAEKLDENLDEKEVVVADEQVDTDTKDQIITFLRELAGMKSEERVYVLKNLSPQKIELLKEILNAHNVTLRAFIKA
ncbi:MAG: hypothetical protein H8E25_11585 [Planctomycetes bacterium]|nr:hypothetical protein [Planctomycetota bacterium]